ncbi:MAG: LysM peptidoglycan-binding domain-containing protein [Gammaproteobacteria bacterium]|nr:LysM peptidoglycan-binding domain-containing protein [Gammaproteobacteria bacterium]
MSQSAYTWRAGESARERLRADHRVPARARARVVVRVRAALRHALAPLAALALSACATSDGLRLGDGMGDGTGYGDPLETLAAATAGGHFPGEQALNAGDMPVDHDHDAALSLTDWRVPGSFGIAEGDAVSADLWARARERFSLDYEMRKEIVRQREWFERNQEYLDRVADRARFYLHHIVNEVERRGMPGEIAMLPIVESAYHPFAYSHARASGIWQFIPSTGRLYGLRRSWWYDGRRDVVESTRAALDYLENLHAEFDGDWLLAVAAYNSGEGNVRKAIRRNLRAGKPVDFWSLRLPRETRSYVPRLLAVSQIVADPARFGLSLKPIPDVPYFASAEIDGQIDLALAAELAEVTLDEIYLLNPGFSRWATDPEGPHRLLLPLDSVAAFEAGLARLPAEDRVQWARHEITHGDTLSTIARKYGTSVVALKQANELRGNMIRAGHSLIVPVSARPASDYALSAEMRRNLRRVVPGSGTKVVYRVRRGDNLWLISRRYGVSMNKLAGWNGLSRASILRPGQRLVVYLRGEPEQLRTSAAPRVTRTAAAVPVGDDAVHVVRRGENLWSIARRYRIPPARLAEWNGIGPNDILHPGQTLNLTPPVTEET